MEEKLRYLSPEWRDEAERRLLNDLSAETMNYVTSSMSNIYLHCPDGSDTYLIFDFEKGKLKKLVLGQGEAPEAEFRITGEYETYAQISQAKLTSLKALMTGKLKLKGNMVKALKLASIVDRMNKVLATIPAEYGEASK